MMGLGNTFARPDSRRHAFAAALMAMAALGGAAPTAVAQQLTWPRDRILQNLARDYEEAPAAYGVTRDGAGIVELVRTEEGDTWTLILTTPNGISRVLASGSMWTPVPLPLPPML